MDTPQVDARPLLREVAAGLDDHDAVLGPAARRRLVGARRWRPARTRRRWPASRCPRRTTGAGHARRCWTAGWRSATAPRCATSTRSTDADAVAAAEAPDSRFAAAWRVSDRCRDDRRDARELPCAQVFADALRGDACQWSGSTTDRCRCRWPLAREADAADRAAARPLRRTDPRRRLRPGPDERARWRERGHVVLGIDVVPEAVAAGPASAASRRCSATSSTRCPGEGRWDTALLADGNIGIGGTRSPCCAGRGAARARGRVVVDLAPPGTGVAHRRATWRSAARRHADRSPGPWSGVDAIGRRRGRGRAAGRAGSHADRAAAGSRSWSGR